MPTLIDNLIHNDHPIADYGGGRWRIAKPLNPHPRKLWNAWLVLRGKAFAVEYYEDKIARDSAKAGEGKG